MAFLLALLLSAPVLANTLKICNRNTDRKIYSAYMKLEGNGHGWQSRGWYSAEANHCATIDLGTYLGKVYLYAEDEYKETTWGEGNTPFCVHSTNGFTYDNGDSMPCTDSGQKKVASYSMDVQEGENIWNLEPNVTRLNLCNDNSDFAIYSSYAVQKNNQWTSRGWYKIDQNTCRNISIGKVDGLIYTYAEYNGGELSWGDGPFQFCVHKTQGFSITDAEKPCTEADQKRILATERNVITGTNEIRFEAKALSTTLRLCNDLASKTLHSVYATVHSNGLRSKGWVSLPAKSCKTLEMAGYTGRSEIYAEWNGGEEYWGSGPTNVCVHKTDAFDFEEATNTAKCSNNIKNKMVPTYRFDLIHGLNTFTFGE